MTGANRGEWFDGRPRTISAASATLATPAKSAGSAPPSSQYTHGTPGPASSPTSSLPVTGPGSSTRPGPKNESNASRTRSQAAASLITAGKDVSKEISGSRGAPE